MGEAGRPARRADVVRRTAVAGWPVSSPRDLISSRDTALVRPPLIPLALSTSAGPHCMPSRLPLPASRRLFLLLACFCLVGLTPCWAQPAPVKTLILPGESFLVAERPAFILWPEPKLRREPQPWVCYAPTLPPYPDEHEKWMHQRFLEAGVAVCGIDVGEAYGSPQGREWFSKLYEELTQGRGFARQPCLLGRSRGGLWVTAWAAEHPDRVAGLAGIYPVFDLRSYPGLERAAPAFQLTPSALEQQLAAHNPINRVSVLAKAAIPVCLIHGDQDEVVPLAQNSNAFREVYRQAGAEKHVQLIVAKGQGHNYWEGFFRSPELVEFVIARAKAGAAAPKKAD